jgi:hypothetical protein
MARSTFARTGTMVILAVSTLAACDRTATGSNTSSALPTEASFARGSSNAGGNGGGKGGSAAQDQPTMAITPTQLSLAVGQQFTVAVTYWDNRGNVIPVTDDKLVYYGCRKLADTDPDCYSVIEILPLQPKGREAQITGKAPGSVTLWAYDGVGTWVTSNVTVQ